MHIQAMAQISPKEILCFLCDGHYFRPLRNELKLLANWTVPPPTHSQHELGGSKMGGCGLLSRVNGQVMRCSRRQRREPSCPMSNCCDISRGRASSEAPKGSAMSGNWSENEGHGVNAASWASHLRQNFKAAASWAREVSQPVVSKY